MRLLFLVLLLVSFFAVNANAIMDFDLHTFQENFEEHNDQQVLVGKVDSMAIIRDKFEYYFTDGEMVVMDFGTGRPCAFWFTGNVRLIYTPPNEQERYQLRKFKKQDKLDVTFDRMLMYFTVELENFPDISNFKKETLDKNIWYKIRDAKKDARDNLNYYIAGYIATDLLTDGPGTYIYADFYINKFEHLVFIENPLSDDKYQLMHFLWVDHQFRRNFWGCYTDESHLASHRGYHTIDIEHYDIESNIESGDNMIVKCRMHYTPVRWGQKFLHLSWHSENTPIAAYDSKGNKLEILHRKKCSNFGVILEEPGVIGEKDFIDIEYKNESLIKAFGFFISKSETYWYPRNTIIDKATFDMSFKCNEDFTAVVSANRVDFKHEGRYNISKWKQDYPVEFVTFELGLFESEEFSNENLPSMRFYNWKFKQHKERQAETNHDILKALEFYGILLGACPFDTMKVTEILGLYGIGAPGLLQLSYITTFSGIDANKSVFERFRAYEVAQQWFGYIVNAENYKDHWIVCGLAEYSAFLFYQSVFGNVGICNETLKNWRVNIIEPDNQMCDGSKAGPVIMGYRLNSSKSYDYSNVVLGKGAYIFHMIRYLFYDFKTDSDEAFEVFLRDIVDTYKNKPITTDGLKIVLEKHIQSDLTWFFDQYVYGVDIPTYDCSYKSEKNDEGQYIVTCKIKQSEAPDEFMMIMPLTVVFDGDRFAHFRHWVSGPEIEFKLPPLPLEPVNINFNTFGAVLARVHEK